MTGRPLSVVVLAPGVDPWERQPYETVHRHNQFCAYRDAGRTRTVRKAATALDLNDRYVRELSDKGRWVERAEAWDRHRDRLHEGAWLEQRRAAADVDAKMLGAMVGKLAARLNTLDPTELEVPDLIRGLDVVMRHRRALFGDPALTVAVTGPGGDPLTVQLAEFAGMTAEARRLAVANLLADVQRGAEAVAGADDDDD